MIRKSCILSVILTLGFVLCLTNGFADEWAEFTEAIRVAEEMKSAADRLGDIQGTPESPKVPGNNIGTPSTAPPAQMYWTDTNPPKIQRADLNGANIKDLVTTGLRLPGDIALDMAAGKMYWTDWGSDTIHRADLDGSNVQTLVTGLNNPPWGIALDAAAGTMYWTMSSIGGVDGEILCANLDGTNVRTVVTGLQDPRYIALDVAGGKMYWTIAEPGASAIQRADLNGTNVEDLVTTELSLPGGIALDVVGGKMYWTDWGFLKDAIYRADLDGSNVQTLVPELDTNPWGIAVDGAAGKMYWTMGPHFGDHEDEIRRANLDGSNVQTLVTGLDRARYIALGIEQTSGSIITFSPSEIANQTFTVGTYASLNLPIATGGTEPYNYTLTPAPPAGLQFDSVNPWIGGTPTAPMPATLYTYTATDANGASAALTFTIEVVEEGIPAEPLDVNGDGRVTVIDLAIVALFYGTQVPAGISLPADVNADGVVNLLDLTAVAQGIDAAASGVNGLSLEDVEAALLAAAEQVADLEAVAGAPMGFVTRQDILSGGIAYRNVADAFADAKHLAITGDAQLGKEMAVLKGLLQLLAEMGAVPEKTALLPNYPNPFNPETWIPYHLSTDATVIVTIYNVRGRIVRVLDFGHQAAGMYQSRSRAAYWDGKNALGEPVASGVYFYTLTAGDFTATRKLLIAK